MIFLKKEQEIEYFSITVEEIDKIKELWKQNGKYHANLSDNFSIIFETLSFEERMEKLKEIEDIHITLALFKKQEIGYCLSTIEKKRGELLSFFVDERFRSKGIGSFLIKEHIKWLKEKGVSIQVDVLYENEKTLKFYQKHGLQPFTITMLIPEKINKI